MLFCAFSIYHKTLIHLDVSHLAKVLRFFGVFGKSATWFLALLHIIIIIIVLYIYILYIINNNRCKNATQIMIYVCASMCTRTRASAHAHTHACVRHIFLKITRCICNSFPLRYITYNRMCSTFYKMILLSFLLYQFKHTQF